MTSSARALTLLSLALFAPCLASAASQTIAFDAIPVQIFGGSPFPIAAQASSGLPVTFTVTSPGVCKLAGGLVMLLSPGPCFITASQPGNGNYSAATATQSFTVSAAKPSGTLTAVANPPAAFGTNSLAVATGDFNGDGIPDLAEASGSNSKLNILIGNGSGGFTPTAASPITVTSAGAVVVGDFNGDGFEDIAVFDQNIVPGASVTVLLGDGTGRFSVAPGGPTSLPGFLIGPLIVGDFNGDGIQDLATATSATNSASVTILLGTGSGGFTVGSPISLPSVSSPPVLALAVGDFNGDQIQDLAVASSTSNSVVVLIGNGSGGFTVGGSFATGAGPVDVAAGDFNGDGILDLATANRGDNNVTVLIGNASGGFTPAANSPFVAGAGVGYVAVADFDGDGRADIAIGGLNQITILLGNGSGGFTPAINGPFNVGSGFQQPVVGDFNVDGIQDLVAVTTNGANMTTMLGGRAPSTTVLTSPPGTIGTWTVPYGQIIGGGSVTVSPSGPAFALASGINISLLGDGTLNIPRGPLVSGVSQVLLNLLPPVISVGSHSLVAGYTGDSRLAASTSNTLALLVVQDSQTITFGVLSNVTLGVAPFGLFANSTSGLPVSFASATSSVCTVAGTNVAVIASGTCSINATQAGNADYLPATPVVGSFTVSAAGVQAQTISFAPLTGGNLGSSVALSATATSGLPVTLVSITPAICIVAGSVAIPLKTGTCSITASQLGNSVWVVASPITRSLTIRALPSGTLVSGPAFTAALNTPGQSVTADFNNDGIQDFALINGLGVQIFLGDGTGRFNPGSTASGLAASAIATGDFNGDGNADFVTVSNTGTFILWAGNGRGAFTPSQGWNAAPASNLSDASSGVFAISVGDFDGDGIQDIAFGGSGGSTGFISVFLGSPQTGFRPAPGTPIVVANLVTWLAAGDFNGDGHQDLAAESLNNQTFQLMVFPGDGSGNFSAATGSPFSIGNGSQLVTGDFNGDGITDILASPGSVGAGNIYLGSASGTFTVAPGPFAILNASPGPLATGDFDGDGNLDVVAAPPNNGSLTFFLGDGGGSFGENVQTVPVNGLDNLSLTSGDFNHDGRTDLLVTDPAGTATILLGAAAPTAMQVTLSPPPLFGQTSQLTATVANSGSAFRTPAGTASISVDNTASVTANLANGVATFTVGAGLSVGNHTAAVNYPGNGGSGPSANTLTFTVAQGPQTISFSPATGFINSSSFTVNATASSGLMVSFSSNTSSICSVTGTTVTFFETGSCSITASQPGNGNYAASPVITQSFSVVTNTGQTTTCSTTSSSAVFIRAEGTTEQVADATLSCIGGGNSTLNVSVYLSPAATITSGVVGSGGTAVNETLAGVNAVSTSFASGAVHGSVSGSSVTFTGIPVTPGAFSVTITNIKINASQLATSAVPTAVTETIFVSGTNVLPGVLQPATVAYATSGLAGVQSTGVLSTPVCSALASATPAFNVQFAEGFANAFKVQGSAGTNSTTGSSFTNNTETGFGVSVSGATNAATSGTRIKVIFNNIPANVGAYVPVSLTNSGGVMTLTASEAGPFLAVPASTAAGAPASSAALTVASGSATAIYEKTTSSPDLLETYSIPVYLVAAANAITASSPAITATVSFAPIGAASNVPSFVNGSSTTTVIGSGFTPCGSGTPQTISFAPLNNIPLSAGSVTLSATASSGLPVSFASTTQAVCTVMGNLVTLASAGACSITATQAGGSGYAAAASVTQTFSITSSNAQTISFGQLSNVASGTSSIGLSATASSGLPVTFASTTLSVCTVSGTTVIIAGTGACSITATQAGNGSYTAATPVIRSFSIVVNTGPATCSAAAANAVFIRQEGTTEQVADLTIGCTGGNALPMNLTVYMSPQVNITSATVSGVSEAIAGLNATSTSLAAGPVNGVVTGSYVTFPGVPTAAGAFTLTITNIKIDASSIATNTGSPLGVSETIFVSGAAVTPAVLPTTIVAYSTNGLGGVNATGAISNLVCNAITTAAPAFNIQFAEGFTAAFKVQGSATSNSALDSWFTNHTETGYGVSAIGSTNTATSGTRVKIIFNNIPANAALYVPLTIANNGGIMTLTASETGAFSAIPASMATGAPANAAAATVIAGSATVIYEATATSSGAAANYNVPVYLVADAGVIAAQSSPITATVSLAPIGAAANVPNFVSGSSAATVNGATFGACGTSSVPQTITFAPLNNTPITAATVTLTATASSHLPVSFASTTTGICTVAANVVTLANAGACSITASQPGDSNYAPATPAVQAFTITSSNAQTITFGPLSTAALGAAPFTISATASSALAVSFASTTTAVCTVSGSTVTLLTLGTCSITATQPGNGIYVAATPVSQSFSVVTVSSTAACSTAAANAVFVRAESTTELVADTTVSCTGGNGLPINLTVYLSPAVSVTSAILNSVGVTASEALAGLGVSGGSLGSGAVHGVASGSSVTFTGVPTGIGAFSVTITNIKINASQIALSNGVPNAVTETIFASGSAVTPSVLPVVNVAFAVNGLTGVGLTAATSSPVCSAITSATPSFSVQFGENFLTAFKTQGNAAFNTTLGSEFTNRTETGYGAIFGVATNTATSGTRVKIIFNNIPSNVAMYVPLTATNTGATMTLTASETGAFSAVFASGAPGAPTGTAAVTVVAASAIVVYEETTNYPGAIESYNIPVYLVAAAGTVAAQAQAITATVSLAPIGAASNVPNFINGSSTVTLSGSTFVGCASTITFAPLSNVVFGSGNITLSATTSSGSPVTFASTTAGVCTVSGNTVSLVSGGACSITASQAATALYAAAPNVIQGFTVTPAAQTISFGTLSNISFSATPIVLTATSTSGLPVSFTSLTGATCTVSGNTLTLVGIGFCLINATQTGTTSYSAAANVQQGFTVSQATQTISFDTIPNQIFGVSPFAIAAQSNLGLPVVIASTTPTVCKTASGLVMLLSAGTCSITASQSGNTDSISAASVARSFTISQAKPSGTLTASAGSPFAVGTNPVSMAAGDFNGDGITDLVTANNGSNNVTVLLGTVSGGFTPAPGSPFAAETNPYAVAVGDFNGDGLQDIAVSGANDGTVTILLGNGLGGFSPVSGGPFSVGAPARSLAVGDFNNDGIEDLVTANANGVAGVFLGSGSGTFAAASGSPFAAGAGSDAVVVADFNGDGNQDIAIANNSSSSNNVTILLGTGSGGFTVPPGSPFSVSPFPDSLVVGDFNGDGVLDLVVGSGQIPSSLSGTVTVFLGTGSGGFSQAPGGPYLTPAEPSVIVAGDFNGDGNTDVAIAEWVGGVTVLSGDGKGGFSFGSSQFVNLGTPGLVEGDFNADGVLDLAIARNGTDDVALLLGGVAATSSVLQTTSQLTISPGQSVPLSLTVSDTTAAFNPPTGTATFSDGSTILGTASQTASPYTFTAVSLGVGSHTLTATYSGDARTSGSTSNTITIQINLVPQTITFAQPSSVPFGPGTVTLTATASSTLPVTFASTTSAICTVTGTAVTLVSAGSCSIRATQTGNGTYAAAAAVIQSLVITQAAQTIAFAAPAGVTLPAAAFALTATSTSGLTVTFASTTTNVCTLSGATATPVTSGTCTITASQTGNTNYLAATPVTQSFTINPAASSGGGGGGGGGAPPSGGSPLTISPTTLTINAALGGSPGTATITLTYQTFTQGAPSFSSNFNTSPDQGWLSLSPASGTLSQASLTGLLYTYSATITVSGDPKGLAAGAVETGNININSGGNIVSATVTMNVSSQPAKFTVAPQQLSFTYQQGSSTLPATQSLSIFSVPTGASFTATASSTGNWLTAGAGTGTPAAIPVSVNVNGLAAGTYSGSIAIGALTVPVSLTVVKATPPVLSVSPTTENLGTATSGEVTVSNIGGGTLQFTASSDQPWLTTNSSGSATPGAPASLSFAANPSGLTPGIYTGHIAISDNNSAAQSVVSVVFTIPNTAIPVIQLSKSGVTLTGVTGGAAPQTQSVTVSNTGAGTLSWTLQTSTTSGGNWLTASGSGTSLSISASTTGLAAGQYYGSVNVAASNATNSPQSVSVVLNVLAATASPGISVSTGGLLLVGSGTQTVGLYNAGSAAIAYTASVFTATGSGWLTVSPASGTANPGGNTILIAANLSGLTGLQTGSVTLAFGDGSTATIQVGALAISGAAGSARSGGLQPLAAVTACPAGKASYLIPIFREPSSQSAVQVASATTVQVQVIDDCGHAVTSGSVQVTFGNGDPGMNLNSIGSGIWEATWVPQNAASSVALQVTASENGLIVNSSLSVLSSVTVAVLAASANAAPQPTGIANAASGSQATPEVVAPGSYIAIYGTGLASGGNPAATSLPLPTTLNGTQLFLGGLPMPLLYAGGGQVNALVPQGIAPNATYPLVVVRGTAQSVPVALTVTELQPGIYTYLGSGIVTNALTTALITASNPAHAGDYLVIYATGLGALVGGNGEAEPTDGAAASTTVVYHTTATVTATIGGVTTPVLFSGLTATLAGLYQVNVQVPTGVTPGTAVPVVLTATDNGTGVTATGNSVTIAVQ